MNFGEAIEALKAGKRAARAGWNGKGMWLALTPGSRVAGRVQVPASDEEERMYGVEYQVAPNLRGAARLYAEHEDQPDGPEAIRVGAHIDMRAADGSLVIGWLASQTDMLAEDWVLVGE